MNVSNNKINCFLRLSAIIGGDCAPTTSTLVSGALIVPRPQPGPESSAMMSLSTMVVGHAWSRRIAGWRWLVGRLHKIV